MGKIVFANWKNKVVTEADAIALARATDAAGLVLLPPHEYAREVAAVITHAEFGMQDYAPDARVIGARYAVVGHADRRRAGDTDAIVAEKLALAVADGIIPVLCVGESRAERDSGITHEVLKRQIRQGLLRLTASSSENPMMYFAYEPLWAISTGAEREECSAETAVHRIAYIKEQLLHLHIGINAKYIYGGSVTSKNAVEYLHTKDIDGLLVGAASINPEELKKIWHLALKS